MSEQAIEDSQFDALYRECVADVHAYVRSLLGDRASSEDVTAAAFERLYRMRSRLDGSRGTPRALLFTIARNAALDELRRRKRSAASEPELLAAEESTEAAVDLIERRQTLRTALAMLDARDREIVLLKFHGGLRNAELARALGISESNAGTRLHRALRRLREHCEEDPARMEVA